MIFKSLLKLLNPSSVIKLKDIITPIISGDKSGRVFIHKNKIYRLISKDYETHIINLINSPLFKELIALGYFPKTKISKLKLQNYPNNLLLEHEKVIIGSLGDLKHYTIDMKKDLAIFMLNLKAICDKHGFTLIDGHFWNITLYNNKPIFLDLGSFILKGQPSVFEEEFLRYFVDYVLVDMNPQLYYAIKAGRFTLAYKDINEGWINKNTNPSNIENTLWENYHDELFTTLQQENFEDKVDLRYKRIKELIQSITKKDCSIVDLAGNMGMFLYYLYQSNINFKTMINVDYDAAAINKSYLYFKSNNVKISSYCSNLMGPYAEDSAFISRIKSDIVVALAVTHHLLLSQYYNIDSIFKRIRDASNKYVFIEFMPLGLWGGEGKELPWIPDYYNEKWFEENFKKFFNLRHKEKLEANRILFIGKIKRKPYSGF